jgi:hypothetical protein
MKVSDDLNKETFHNVTVKEALPTSLEAMYDHFHTTVQRAQRYFLAKKRAVDVQNLSGIVMKCDVELSGDGDDSVNVWPHSDGNIRKGILLNRGTLALIVLFCYWSFIVFP